MDLIESTSLYCDLSQFDNAGLTPHTNTFQEISENKNTTLYRTHCEGGDVEKPVSLNECSQADSSANHLLPDLHVLVRGSPDSLVEKTVWNENIKVQEHENHLIKKSDNSAFNKDLTPANLKLSEEAQVATCDNDNSSNGEDFCESEEVPRLSEKISKFPKNDLAADETVVKVVDDGVIIAWMDAKQIKSNDGCQFYCSICKASFKSRTNVVVHLRLHKISKPYYCAWCGESSQTEFEAKVHYRSHSGVQRFTCAECGRRFSKEKMLERHRSNCGSRNPCTKRSPQPSNDQSPSARQDGEINISETLAQNFDAAVNHCNERPEPSVAVDDPSRCKQLNEDDQKTTNLDSEPALINEFDSCEVENPSGKNRAGTKKTSKGTASKQEKESKHNKETRRNFVCLTCGKAFKASKPLREHEVVHTGAREFPCEICGKAFGTRANMKIHLSTHSDKRPFACNVCNATFRQKDSLKVHLRKHNGERPFVCTICKMTFDRNFTLKNHLLTHGEVRSFVCVVCGKAFTTRGGLNNHERLHFKDPSEKKERKPPSKPGTGNWICDECGKMYSTRSNLKMHQRSHRGAAVTYPCCVCGRIYKHKDSLEVHMRRHRDQRPYNCPTCGRNFYRNWTLKLHILTHTGEKPHKCPVSDCDKAFTQSSSLYYHVQSHSKKVEKENTSVKDDVPRHTDGDSNATANIPANTLGTINIPSSDSMMLNVDARGNEHPSENAPLFVPNPNGGHPSGISNSVGGHSFSIERVLNGTSPSLDGGTLSIKVAVEGIHSSVLNGMVLNNFNAMSANAHVTLADSIDNRASLNQTETIPRTNTLLNHVVEPVSNVNTSVDSLCQPRVGASTVWENSVLPFSMNNMSEHSAAISSLRHSEQSGPPPLRPLSQTIDQPLYLLSSGTDSVPLLVSVNNSLYQDVHDKTSAVQSVYVQQLN